MKDIIKRILKENVDIILNDKIIKLMRRPYINFLREIVGLEDEKSVKEIMERKLGDGKIRYDILNYHIDDDGHPKLRDNLVYTFTWSNPEKVGEFYEEKKYGSGRVEWRHSEKTVTWSVTKEKYINSRGEKFITMYDTRTGGNWAYIDSKRYPNLNGMGDDKFFSNIY